MPTLEFTLMVGCPLKCTFCPQDALMTAYGRKALATDKYMSFDTFKAIVDKVPAHVRIDFSGMAEPWANPAATEMLRYALGAGRLVAVYTTLYGVEADGPEVVRLLADHRGQVDVLCLHLPDAAGNMRGWRWSAEYEANVRRFFGLRGLVRRFEAMTMSGSGEVHPDLAALGIGLGAWMGHTRAGNVEAPAGQAIEAPPRHETAVVCGFTPFYDQNVVLPNGDVVLCCMDYSARHRLGNLIEQDYYDIFAGAELGRLRAENMKLGAGSGTLCKTCNRAAPLRSGGQFWAAS